MKLKILSYISLFMLFLLVFGQAFADTKPPYLFVLGVGQDAGLPQTGCYQPHCMPGWLDPALRRDAVSLALVEPDTRKKYIFEATPDFPRQLYRLEVEAPSDQYDLEGIFLTHAHIGHYTGLMFLGKEAMGANQVPVYAMPRMAEFLKTNGPWSQLVDLGNIVLQPLVVDEPVGLGRVQVSPFLVPHRDEYSETVGYFIEGPSKSALFVPDIDKWDKWQHQLQDIIQSVDYALIDATFFADGELPGRDMSKIPHPFVVESMQLLQSLDEQQRKKVWFIHMNHSNPLLDPGSDQSIEVRAKGFNVAVEGLRLDL